MQAFHNILVGIDIDGHGNATENSREALKQACRVARKYNAALSVVHVINMPDDTRNVLKLQPQAATNEAERVIAAVLESLKESASGLSIQTGILFGNHWRELIAEVLRKQHDLVVLGTRSRGVVGRALFGSTGNRLLRYCPCPVWVVRSREREDYRDILVADDMSEVGEQALAIGAMMAMLYQARLHVLHVIEHIEQRRFMGTVPESIFREREQEVLGRLVEQCRGLVPESELEVRVCSGNPHSEILDYLRRHENDLLCMGTVARSGISGIVTGNTAENVLPWIGCDLIAVKPAGFKSLSLI